MQNEIWITVLWQITCCSNLILGTEASSFESVVECMYTMKNV